MVLFRGVSFTTFQLLLNFAQSVYELLSALIVSIRAATVYIEIDCTFFTRVGKRLIAFRKLFTALVHKQLVTVA